MKLIAIAAKKKKELKNRKNQIHSVQKKKIKKKERNKLSNRILT